MTPKQVQTLAIILRTANFTEEAHYIKNQQTRLEFITARGTLAENTPCYLLDSFNWCETKYSHGHWRKIYESFGGEKHD